MHLPLRRDLTLAYPLSLAVALVMAVASVAGLVYQTDVYPDEALLQSYVPNDAVNLVVGLPILLGSMWLARRGRLIGLLFWPGALFYVVYTYIVYVLAMPVNMMFLVYLTLVVLSTYTMLRLIASLDGQVVAQRLVGAVPDRLAGGVLAVLGVAFFLRVIAIVAGSVSSQTPIAAAELALHVGDLVLSPAWVIAGVLLWRRQALGYVIGPGVLFQACALFVGVILIILLQPFFTAAPLDLAGVIAVSLMGLVCFVPFALFVRGAY
jgi:hypothetical protein